MVSQSPQLSVFCIACRCICRSSAPSDPAEKAKLEEFEQQLVAAKAKAAAKAAAAKAKTASAKAKAAAKAAAAKARAKSVCTS